MIEKKEGFTLIELLVVVLIIGILAAIALPMYNRSVEKSKWMEAVVFQKALKDSEDRYLLETGAYATDFSLLDIDLSSMKNFTYVFHTTPLPHIEAQRIGYNRWLTNFFNGNLYCGVATSDTAGKAFCSYFTGSPDEPCPESGYTCYKIK